MKNLRPYQTDCLEAVKTAVHKGQRHILVRMATGGGKTFTFAHLPWLLGAHRTMVVAHRDELLRQAGKTMKELGLTVGYEVAQEVADGTCQVVVASVQSLRNGRLAKFNPADFDLLIIDECHHSCAPSYKRLVQHFRNASVVGFTATPYRSDKQELTDVFTDGVVFDLGLMDLIRKGYLTPIKVVKHDIQSKYEPKHVLKAYKKHASGKKSIVFCKDIAHTVEMAKTFTKSGVVAMPVYNGMGKEEREGALKKFASNEIQVLTNCNVLTEGFDEPSIQCVVLARNTSSRALYEQMIGRGTRLHENKTKLKVVQLIPVPPPRPVPVAERAQRVWRWLRPILWLVVMAGISLWLWRTCGGSTQQAEEIVNRTPSLHVVSMCKVRREPSTRAKQVGLIGPLDELKKLGERRIKDQNWAKVQVGKLTGWCGCKLEMK